MILEFMSIRLIYIVGLLFDKLRTARLPSYDVSLMHLSCNGCVRTFTIMFSQPKEHEQYPEIEQKGIDSGVGPQITK